MYFYYTNDITLQHKKLSTPIICILYFSLRFVCTYNISSIIFNILFYYEKKRLYANAPKNETFFVFAFDFIIIIIYHGHTRAHIHKHTN
jgi:hypothetical protein